MKGLKKINVTMQIHIRSFAVSISLFSSCANNNMTTSKPVQLITLDPGHFHAALVQKTMYGDVDSVVHVYAPEGNDLKLHLDRINAYNTRNQFKKISAKYSGVELYKSAKGWSVKLPERLIEGHEAHFARVMEKFLDYLKNKNMPTWEVPNMLAKYYTTTKALELALKNK